MNIQQCQTCEYKTLRSLDVNVPCSKCGGLMKIVMEEKK